MVRPLEETVFNQRRYILRLKEQVENDRTRPESWRTAVIAKLDELESLFIEDIKRINQAICGLQEKE